MTFTDLGLEFRQRFPWNGRKKRKVVMLRRRRREREKVEGGFFVREMWWLEGEDGRVEDDEVLESEGFVEWRFVRWGTVCGRGSWRVKISWSEGGGWRRIEGEWRLGFLWVKKRKGLFSFRGFREKIEGHVGCFTLFYFFLSPLVFIERSLNEILQERRWESFSFS